MGHVEQYLRNQSCMQMHANELRQSKPHLCDKNFNSKQDLPMMHEQTGDGSLISETPQTLPGRLTLLQRCVPQEHFSLGALWPYSVLPADHDCTA